MMMRTVFSLTILILSVSMASAADPIHGQSEADLATLIRNHGFVNTVVIKQVDDAIVDATPIADDAVSPAADHDADHATGSADDAIHDSQADDDHADGGYEAPIVQSQGQSQRYYAPQRRAPRGGVLSELIELERRKNAWLKRTFFGR